MLERRGLSSRQRAAKRAFDLMVAGALLLVTWPVMLVAVVSARIDTGASGIYRQKRVGRDGELFEVRKIRTMRVTAGTSTVTAAHDARITRLGRLLRKSKIDELPQLLNVLAGEMSLVGPRPDVPGYADVLTGADRVVLTVRPGITGPASVYFRHEEDLLAAADDPEAYNRDVIWPEKIRINREYVEGWTLMTDVRCLRDTVRSVVAHEAEEAR
jgi:lipopolysaccharide/colanic/teichoic acid biosynthesis glycosyltransferase